MTTKINLNRHADRLALLTMTVAMLEDPGQTDQARGLLSAVAEEEARRRHGPRMLVADHKVFSSVAQAARHLYHYRKDLWLHTAAGKRGDQHGVIKHLERFIRKVCDKNEYVDYYWIS